MDVVTEKKKKKSVFRQTDTSSMMRKGEVGEEVEGGREGVHHVN